MAIALPFKLHGFQRGTVGTDAAYEHCLLGACWEILARHQTSHERKQYQAKYFDATSFTYNNDCPPAQQHCV